MENKKNVFWKLQAVRVDLQKKEMKKSGKNTFSHYDYFELSDFLPIVNELCMKHGITPIITFTPQEAKLTIYNQEDKEDTIEFTSPFVVCELKGSNRLQSLGSSHTYLRRYLYLCAFELVESDGMDGLSEEDRKEVKPVNEAEENKKEELIKFILKNKENEKLKESLKEVLKKEQAKNIKELSTDALQTVINSMK